MKAKSSHDMPFANWRTMITNGVIQSEYNSLRTRRNNGAILSSRPKNLELTVGRVQTVHWCESQCANTQEPEEIHFCLDSKSMFLIIVVITKNQLVLLSATMEQIVPDINSYCMEC